MAVPAPQLPTIPPPTDAEAAALDVARGYLRRAGTHAASRLLGFPPPTKAVAEAAEFSNVLLAGAALCEGLLDLADERRRE